MTIFSRFPKIFCATLPCTTPTKKGSSCHQDRPRWPACSRESAPPKRLSMQKLFTHGRTSKWKPSQHLHVGKRAHLEEGLVLLFLMRSAQKATLVPKFFSLAVAADTTSIR